MSWNEFSLDHPLLSPYLLLPCLLFTALGYLLRQKLLPKPLQGIPYNPEAIKSVFGDVPSVIKWKQQHGEQRRWFQAQAVKMNSPICQVFTKPFFYGPQVILTDPREIHDIFHRRFREFDKGYKEAEAFGGIIPDELLSLKLASPEYRFHKDLMRDLMLPQFLNNVNAPEIYSKVMLLVDLWKLKSKITNGRPFIFKEDIHKAALDIIMAVSFGLEQRDACIQKQLDEVSLNHVEDYLSAPYQPYHFNELPMEKDPAAITTLAASVEVGFNSPLPVQHHWVLRQLPHLGCAVKTKNAMMRAKINDSLSRMPQTDEEAMKKARTALDNMLYRERLLASKAGRRPNFHASYIYDEMLAYVIAGHDTTANTFSWGLIYLADHQQPQLTLRTHLLNVFATAVSQRRQPTANEIIKSHAPYLDAVIEEILRCSVVLPMVSRQAQVDTTILGHPIPKGTLIMCMSNGPGFFRPTFTVDESLRSKTSQAAPTSSLGSWDEQDMHLFKPERWLEYSSAPKDSQTGEQKPTWTFNPKAGPMNSFGGGPRGCFGRRLAYMELRILTVLLLWNFRLLPVAPDMRSYRRREQITVEPADCHVRLEERAVWADV